MRKLLFISIGFTLACALCAYFLLGNQFLNLGVYLLIFSVIACFAVRNIAWKRIIMILLGFSLGLTWFRLYDISYLSLARSLDGEMIATSVRISDYSFDTGYGMGADGKITLEDKTYRVRVYFSHEEEVPPGSVIHGQFRIRYTPPGGEQEPTYHRGQGIFLMAYETEKSTVVPATTTSMRYIPAYIRNGISQLLDRMFSLRTAPFAKALLLGDTTDLDYATQTHLMVSGIRHVAAVSGLHVSILFSMVYFLSGKKRFLTALVGLPCLFLFSAVAGFTPSIMRACMMQALMILAIVFNREYDPPTALSFAVLTMLALNPHCITSVGFQLSVASVAGIFLFASKIYNRILRVGWISRLKPKSFRGRVIRYISTSVAVSLSAVVLTAPLTAMYFGCVSLISLLTNLLCLWAVSILFCGIIAACLLGIVFMPGAKILCWLLQWLVRYILGVSQLLSKFPLAAVYTDSIYIVVWLSFCYVLLATFLVMKNKRPKTLACCVLIGLCVALMASWSDPLVDNFRVTAMDVGQGQCIILQNGRKTFVVDCGGDKDEVAADKTAAYLQSQGIYRIDGLILTHLDRDHAGGIPFLLQRVDTDALFLPKQDNEQEFEFDHRGETVVVAKDISISWDEGRVEIFTEENAVNKNESSLCVLFHTEKCDILITGDRSISGEVKLLQRHALADVDILIAGHHGAEDSTGEMLLSAIKPEIVLISVSENNKFGHPSQYTLQRLKKYGCTVRRTDLEGTIIIRG